MAGSINCIDNKTTDSTFFVENTDVSTNTSNLDMRKDRAGAIINSGDTIGNVRFMGFDGAAYQVGARIYGITDGTIAAGRMPTDLFFNTSPDSVSGDLLRMQIAAAGNVTIATPDSGVALTIAGGGETITAGDLVLIAGNFWIPQSASGPTVGVIYSGGVPFLSTYGSDNVFLGDNSGNPGGGNNNIGIGSNVFGNVVAGSLNIAIGSQSAPLLSSGTNNVLLGYSNSTAITSGASNVVIGSQAFINSSTDSNNVIIGAFVGGSLTSGNNTVIGALALGNVTTGSNTICIGYLSGNNYASTEDSNILIGHQGVVADNNTIRIGTQGAGVGQQNTCYIAGITGVSVSNLALVSIDTTTGQLGSTAGGSSFLNALNGDSGTATPSSGAITIAGGTGISTSAAGSTVTINATGAGSFAWTVETGASVSMAPNHGYIANNAGTCVLTLPSVSAVGDVIRVSGMNNNTGWQIAQNAGNTIFFGVASTTPGAGGSLASFRTYDTVELVCNTASADWIVVSSVGTITVT